SNRLGSMGPPVKLMIEGQPVFLCCSGCKQNALANPQATLAKVAELKSKPATEQAAPENAPTAAPNPAPPAEPSGELDKDAKAALAKLSPEDRALAEAQRLCPISKSLLGSMGPPIKLMIEGQPVFLCCDGCKEEALKDAKATLAKVAELKQANSSGK